MDQNQSRDELICSYFLHQWLQNSKTLAERRPNPGTESDSWEDEDETEECPTELDTENSSGGFSVVGPDKLSVLYPNVNLHGHDVGVVHANCAAPSKRLLYYFEMYVKNAGAKGQISIGFIPSSFKVRRHPGWEANSYGYHGDDGLLYRGRGKGGSFYSNIDSKYTTGDTVGAGIIYPSSQLFFTKNGVVVGTTSKDVKGPLFPTVAVHSQGEEVTVNFGKDPFVFDIKAFEAERRALLQHDVDAMTVPLDASHGLIRSYLQHYGYEKTLELLDIATQNTAPPISLVPENVFSDEDYMYAMNQRATLRQHIRRGEIDEAFAKLQKWYPEIFQDETSSICFLLHTQKFIELIRGGKIGEAMEYGRTNFVKFKRAPEFDDLIKDCAALLAFNNPEEHSFVYLLHESQRELVADAVNAIILSRNPNPKDAKFCLQSRLERLLRQISACSIEKRALSGGEGEVFHLGRILQKGLWKGV